LKNKVKALAKKSFDLGKPYRTERRRDVQENSSQDDDDDETFCTYCNEKYGLK
jgi:hypothetical protein